MNEPPLLNFAISSFFIQHIFKYSNFLVFSMKERSIIFSSKLNEKEFGSELYEDDDDEFDDDEE